MITASIIFYKTDVTLVNSVLADIEKSIVDRVYVVDNSPTDVLLSTISHLSAKVEYIYGQGNVGYGAGHNIAIQKAMDVGAKYHVVLNPDIQFSEGTIEAMAKFADTHDRIGMMMPNVTYPNGEQQYLCKLSPAPIDMLGRRLLPTKVMAKRNYRFEMRSTGYNNIRNVPCLSGCFMFLNIDILREVGLFDDRFFMYFEDFDLVRRIHKVAKTVFFPEVTIIHNHATEHRTNKRLLRISIQSAVKYFNKWGWIFDIDRRKWNRAAFEDSSIIDYKIKQV